MDLWIYSYLIKSEIRVGLGFGLGFVGQRGEVRVRVRIAELNSVTKVSATNRQTDPIIVISSQFIIN